MLTNNDYFDGKVKSIAFQSETLPASVGVMSKGQYVFNTIENEKMTVISGTLKIQLTNSTEINTYTAGQSFHVPAGDSFKVTVDSDSSYLCLYG